MKIFLDDVRPVPDESWTLAKNHDEALELLAAHPEAHTISLDHDLGDDDIGTGYDVICWLEERLYNGGRIPKTILIHTANTSARVKMEMALAAINDFRGTFR